MNYVITNLTNEIIDEEIIKNVIEATRKKLNVTSSVVGIVLTSDTHIHELNKVYRNVDAPTDVISFAFLDNEVLDTEITDLGEIYISLDRAHAQAEEYGHSFIRELSFLTVHGLLHLLGYDHIKKEDEKVMFNLQDEILESINVGR